MLGLNSCEGIKPKEDRCDKKEYRCADRERGNVVR